MPASPRELSDWHLRPGAFARLTPPWSGVIAGGAEVPVVDGSVRTVRVREGPLVFTLQARHRDVRPGVSFVDELIAGPFPSWVHTHRFLPHSRAATSRTDAPRASWTPAPPDGTDGQASCLEDQIDYQAPFGAMGDLLFGRSMDARLARLLRWRHERTRRDLARHAPYRERPRLRIAIGGASGLVGAALQAFLTSGGHEVLPLTRSEDGAGIRWRPQRAEIDAAALEGVDALVHLGGESIASGRWNTARKQRLRDSRIQSTRLLATTLEKLRRPPRVFVCASAIGYYGDRGAEELSEDSPPGSGFLADLCREWEAAAVTRADGVRVVNVRIGVVLSAAGGALAKMLPPFHWGVGGRVGDGRQYMSWIGLDDLIGVLHFILMNENLRGPVNATAPQPVSNAEFARTLGHVLRRPALLPLPGALVRLALGEMGRSLLLEGCRVLPKRLQAAGFRFLDSELEHALRFDLGRASTA